MYKSFNTFVLLFLLVPSLASAATLRFTESPIPVHAGDTIAVDVFLDTGNDILNALEGSVNFSFDLVLRNIRYSGSIVPMWVTQPTETQTGMITFAGVIPGGYQGTGQGSSRGNVYTLVFTAHTVGTAHVSFGADTKVYQDDGNGTLAALSTPSLSFTILPAGATAHTVDLAVDATPPEAFTPLIVPGEPYGIKGSALIFSTQDKDSGVAHFDIAYSYNRNAHEQDLSWTTVESPHAIVGADAGKYIYVRAVDDAGNTRVEVVSPMRMTVIGVLHQWGSAVMLFAVLIAVLVYLRSRYAIRRRS